MRDRMVSFASPQEPLGRGDVAAMMMLDLLIACAGDVAAFGSTRDLRQAAGEHVRYGISGRHHSRFGMSLGPALREALGLRISPTIISAWCDTFWLVIGRMAESEESLGVEEYLQVAR